MSMISKLDTLSKLLTQMESMETRFIMESKCTQLQYQLFNTLHWDALQSVCDTPEEIAIVLDRLFQTKLGEAYSWADVLTYRNLRKNVLQDHHGLVMVEHPMLVSAYDVIKDTYAKCN